MKPQQYINIEGASLSHEALAELASLQQGDNDYINHRIEEITELVFWLIQERGAVDHDDKSFLDEKLLTIKCIRDLLILLRGNKEE